MRAMGLPGIPDPDHSFCERQLTRQGVPLDQLGAHPGAGERRVDPCFPGTRGSGRPWNATAHWEATAAADAAAAGAAAAAAAAAPAMAVA
jgi:hypothetical protein